MKCTAKSGKTAENAALHLPQSYPWKVAQALLVDLRQYLSEESVTKLEGILRRRDLDQLMALKQEWGLLSITTSCGPCFAESKAKYQLAALLSRFQFSTNRKTQEANAFKKFIDAEAVCSSFNRCGWKELVDTDEEWKATAVFYARAFLQKVLGFALPSAGDLCEWSRHGPGATLDTEQGKVSSYNKYGKWPYECTSAVFGLAKIAIRSDARWLGALEDDYRERFNIPKHFLLDRKVFWRNVLKIVDGDRICFVPKNAETFRTITIGPTMNLYLQLGVDGFIRRRLKRWGVDLDDQSKNQRLARIGSRGGINPFVTLDLKAASDTVSLKICEILLPDEWNSYLLKLRSPCATYDGTTYWLSKMSAMGNGFTFVLESVIFTALIYGVMIAINGRFDREEFSVFGDDLIVRQDISPYLIRLLSSCGFALNHDKSFFEGEVRESCGTDWVKGIPVRPVFLEDTPTNVMELFGARNRIQRSLSLRWGLEESFTVKMLDKWVPEFFRTHIGPMSDTEFDSHLHSGIPPGKRKHGVWEYRRAVYRPKLQSARSFLFRRLMHDLRPAQPLLSYKERRKLAGTGSRFTVHLRNGETVGTTRSAAWKWQSEYTEQMPG